MIGTQNTATDFRYPANIRGYIPGKSLGRVVGHGPVRFIGRPDGDGEGDIFRNGELIGRLVRSEPNPLHGWTLLDLAGNVVGIGCQQMAVAIAAFWSLPSAAEQAEYLAKIAGPVNHFSIAAE